jgi:hypothetical protein
MGYAIFTSSLSVYIYQQRKLNLFVVEQSLDIANATRELFKIDFSSIRQCLIY